MKIGMDWEQGAMAYLYVLHRHLPGGTEKDHENLSQNKIYSGRYLSTTPVEYNAGVPTTRQPRSVPNALLTNEVTN
jgi:hypothetical protein